MVETPINREICQATRLLRLGTELERWLMSNTSLASFIPKQN